MRRRSFLLGLVASVVLAAEELGVTKLAEVTPPSPPSTRLKWSACERIGISVVGPGVELSRIKM